MSAVFSAEAFRRVLANRDKIKNPHATYGYFHGPWENPNGLNWYPPSLEDRRVQWSILHENKHWEDHWHPLLTHEQNDEAPQTIEISSINGDFCQATVDELGTMCGVRFQAQSALRRHIRQYHRGLISYRDSAPASAAHKSAAKNAWMLYVVTGGWRDAAFATEPGLPSGDIGEMCTALEKMTRDDPALAEEFGSVTFHRWSSQTAGTPSRKRGRGDLMLEDPSSPPPPFSPLSKRSRTASSFETDDEQQPVDTTAATNTGRGRGKARGRGGKKPTRRSRRLASREAPTGGDGACDELDVERIEEWLQAAL